MAPRVGIIHQEAERHFIMTDRLTYAFGRESAADFSCRFKTKSLFRYLLKLPTYKNMHLDKRMKLSSGYYMDNTEAVFLCVPVYLSVCLSVCLSVGVVCMCNIRDFTYCESCTRPILSNPGSMKAGEYSLTYGTCFVARRL